MRALNINPRGGAAVGAGLSPPLRRGLVAAGAAPAPSAKLTCMLPLQLQGCSRLEGRSSSRHILQTPAGLAACLDVPCTRKAAEARSAGRRGCGRTTRDPASKRGCAPQVPPSREQGPGMHRPPVASEAAAPPPRAARVGPCACGPAECLQRGCPPASKSSPLVGDNLGAAIRNTGGWVREPTDASREL